MDLIFLMAMVHRKQYFDAVSFSGGEIIEVTGRWFGDIWTTSVPTRIGGIPAGKRQHTRNMVQIITPPLPPGEHPVELYIENYGLAVLE